MKPQTIKDRNQQPFVDHEQQDLLDEADESLIERINHPPTRYPRSAGAPPSTGVMVRTRLAPMAMLLGYVQVRALWSEPRPAPLGWRAVQAPAQPRRGGWITMAGAPPAGKV